MAVASVESALDWAAICARYHDEWVLLGDVVRDSDDWIATARGLDHDESIHDLLDRISTSDPTSILTQTCGRPLRRPRLVMTDEIRDFLQAEEKPHIRRCDS